MSHVGVVVLSALSTAACVPFVQPADSPRARARIAVEGLAPDARFAGVDIGREPSCRTLSRFKLIPVALGASATPGPTTESAKPAAFALDMDGQRTMEPKSFAREVWIEAGYNVRISVYASHLPRSLYRTVVFLPVNGEDYEIRMTKRALEVARHDHQCAGCATVPVPTSRSRCQPAQSAA
ncbi:hypothetical protein [Cupriavidus sp. Agwp_2]|uniref:hypothetical protein n=1 Tax=Cupriavidus sp. Agwp_2 TaxID=2897324 RepID=UPI00345F4E96